MMLENIKKSKSCWSFGYFKKEQKEREDEAYKN